MNYQTSLQTLIDIESEIVDTYNFAVEQQEAIKALLAQPEKLDADTEMLLNADLKMYEQEQSKAEYDLKEARSKLKAYIENLQE